MSREVLDSRSSYDEVYDDRSERAPRRRSPLRIRIPRSWLTNLRSVAPLAIAFVVGLVIGGAGWNEWQAQRAVAAARGAVSFTAELSSADATSNGIEAYVRLTNNGTEPVIIDELELSNSAVRSSTRRNAEPIEALPDNFALSRLFVEMDCDLQMSSETTVAIRVRTVDGVARSATLPVEDDDNLLDNALYTLCPDPNESFVPLDVTYSGASSIVDEGGPALRMAISLSTFTPVEVTVLTMRAASNKLSVTVDGLPVEVTPDGQSSWTVTATWRVLDCQDVEDLRYEGFGFVVEAQRPGGIVITLRVPPHPNLALDVAKFANDTCRAA
ncbi:MAG TPA: hypothetical protein VJ649_11620 [Actinomycetes bacterium]|nr:hypothetical protein [Actinomycetes bacterium]